MSFRKYIIIEEMGIEIPVLFSENLSHDSFLRMFNRNQIVSAGFFQTKTYLGEIRVFTFGKSVSLKKESREIDEELIKKILE